MDIRRSAQRGTANFGWLHSKHTFSFGDYHDPEHMGFGVLRVINEDRVQPGRASIRMRTATWKSSPTCSAARSSTRTVLGNGSVIRPGDVQRMSAGTGIRHSEFNPSTDGSACTSCRSGFFRSGKATPPSYEQKHFDADAAPRSSAPRRFARRARRIGDDPSGRRSVRRAAVEVDAGRTRAAQRSQRVAAGRARRRRVERRTLRAR